MSKSILGKATVLLGATMAASLGYSGIANANQSLFSAVELDRPYTLMAGTEGSCGEGKCGADKDGEGKCGEGKCGGDKGDEGKCGEGKCGSAG